MATQGSSKPTLYYFNVAGRAEMVRLAFRLGNVEFEDYRMNPIGFVCKHRGRSPTSRVPFLVVDGKLYTESWALLQYAAEKGGLAPVDPLHQLEAEMLALFGDRFMVSIHPLIMPSFNKGKLVKKATEEIKGYLAMWNNMAKEGGLSEGFAVGGKLSIADIVIYSTYDMLLHKPHGVVIDNLESFEALKTIHATVSALPQLQPAKK